MTKPHIPAPERDLAREDPQVPPASREVGTLTNSLFGSLAIGLGIAVIVGAVIAAVFQISPLPRDLFNADEMTAVLLAVTAGLFLIACGVLILRRGSTLLLLGMLSVAVLCGYLSSVVV